MGIIKKDLQWYVDKLKNGEKFSLARYGDGELLCMWGKQGKNSNGCRYSSELREDLLKSMDSSIMHGLQRVLPQDAERIQKEYPNIEWYDTEIFSEAVANGELYPLIEQLKKMKVIAIGNKSIAKFLYNTVGLKSFIFVPPENAYDFQPNITLHDDYVYIFSCGMAANAFIYRMHSKVDAWLIDLGHIWDPFVGNMSRCDLEGKTMEDINKNLCPKE